MAQVLRRLTPTEHPDLLVGAATGDDAAVWRLDDARALVVTADFITPVVDDARTWGRVAAANAVSDVYAMGGAPLLALNLVSWPRDELPLDLLGDVIAGAQDIAAEGAFALVGGHSVDDPEPKFGLAVVGLAHPDRLLRNSGLRPGDVLVLSKAVGVGVITTGIKVERAGADAVEAALASMTKLNAEASRIALARGATGATDVTGFGLLGHLGRAALESGVDVVIETATVPVLPGARELAEQNVVPGGTGRNRAWIADVLDDHDVDDTTVTLLADAQTSGGLVFGVSADEADGAVADLRASGHEAAAVGRVEAGSGRIRLL